VRATVIQFQKARFNDSERTNSLLQHEEEDQVCWHLDKSAQEDVDVSITGQLASA